MWVEACQNPSNLVTKTPSQLYTTYKICSEHFSEGDYRTCKMHRLTATACPKANLGMYNTKLKFNFFLFFAIVVLKYFLAY